MKMSESIQDLVKAMVQFQSKVPSIKKNCQGYGYKYADLNDIMKTIQPILSECGLSVTQNPHFNEQGTEIGIATHVEHISGQYKHFDPVMIPVNKEAKNVAQEIGADVTYSRRYSLSCALNIVTDQDTDGVKPDPKQKKSYSNKTENSNKREEQTSNQRKQTEQDPFFLQSNVTNINKNKTEEDRIKKGKMKIMMLCTSKGITDELRYNITEQLTGKRSLKELTADEMVQVYLTLQEGVQKHA